MLPFAFLCACPQASEITTIPSDDCIEDVGQVQKAILQRTFETGSTYNEMTQADALLLATWTPLLVASDGTKAQVTPFLQNPVSEAGEARTYGGGNQTVGGTAIILGSNPTTFNAELLSVKQSVIKAMKDYHCEKDLSVYLIDEHNRIIGQEGTTAADFRPIEIDSLFITDKRLGGFEEPDKNMISWEFRPNWSDNLVIITPTAFKPLTQL